MSKIVVSYRRADSQAVAGRIVDRLIAHFGERSVFMDIDDIPFGTDFRDYIQSVLSKAAVMIAVVGPDWLGAGTDQHRRIDDSDDPVRVEIEAALRQKLQVIPVLINDATMPAASMLPDGMQAFAFLNAAPVDAGRDFRPHVDRLIRSIETILQTKAGALRHDDARSVQPLRSARMNSRWILPATAALILLLGGAAAWRIGPWNAPAITSAAPTAGPQPSVATVAPPAVQASTRTDPNDENDWTAARGANTYEAYQAYAKHHPQGRHVTDAGAAAVAGASPAEPPIGALPTGQTVLVDDRSCDAGQIKAITGGDVEKHVSRTKKCVSRDEPF